ncbi:PAS domain S-box protein [Chloroflexota bacterium]
MNSTNLPRPTITKWLWLGFGLLISVLALTSLIHYWQIQRIDSNVVQVVGVQEPLERAVLQMQITIDNTAQAISNYARNRDLADANKVRDSEVSFEKLTVEFSRLAHTDQMDHLGQEITRLHEDFKISAYEIVTLVNEQDTIILLFREDVEELGDFINGMIQPTVDGTSPDTMKKLKATLSMKGSLDEVSMTVDAYMVKPDPGLLEQVLDAQEDFRRARTMYGETSLSVYEESWLHHINEQFEETVGASIEIIRITDNLHELLRQFEQSLWAVDTYLNDQVGPMVHAQAIEASEDVQTSVTSASKWLLILGIIGFLIGSASVWVISRNITNPIRQLADGAAIVGSGRLEHRFNIDAKGEFGQLALALNQMLEGQGRSRDALGESEELAWALLDATNDAVLLTDLRGVILASNEVAAARFGRSLEQMIDESLYDLLPTGPVASMRAHIAEVIRSKKSVHYEDEREGKIIDQNIHPVLGGKGEISRLAIFARDITVRKWVEDVTEQLGRRNELILEAAGEGIYGLDTQGKTTFVNPAAARMLGYEPEDLIGQLHHEIVHYSRPDGKPYPNEECPVYRAFKDGAVHTNVDDEVFWRKDGTCFPIEYTSTPIIEDGRILGAVVTFRDITDRKRLEKVLHQSEEKYRSIFESVTSLIISVDEEGMIIDCDARIQHTLGYSPNEIIGRNLLDIIHPDEHIKVRECLEDALNKGFKYNSQFRMAQKDGTFIDASLNAAAIRDASGDYVRTVCMIDEVTQRLRK